MPQRPMGKKRPSSEKAHTRGKPSRPSRNTSRVPRGKGPSGEEQFRHMIDAVVDYAIFTLDSQGHVTTWNSGAKRIKGYNSSEIIGQHYSVFYGDEDIKQGRPQHQLDEASRTGRLEAEGWRLRKNGTQFWGNIVITAVYDADGKLCGFVKVTRDNTERKKAEDALRQSQQWLLTTLRSIGDGVIATDKAGKVKFLNPCAEVLTGWRQDEVGNVHIDEVFKIVNARTREPVSSPFFKVVACEGVVGLANDTVLIARDGTERLILDSGAPIFDSTQQIDGVVIVFREACHAE